MITPNHVRIWRFKDAPEELKQLSDNGGGEDWLALIPPKLTDEFILWLECPYFGNDVSEYGHPELPGYKVKIGAHS